MKWIDIFVMTFSAFLTALTHALCYQVITKEKKLKFNTKCIITIFVEALLFLFNTYYSFSPFTSVLFNIISLTILYYIIFNESIGITVIKGLIIYFLLAFYEIIFSILVIKFGAIDFSVFNKNVYLKGTFSIIVMTISYLTLRFRPINNYIKKVNYAKKDIIDLVVLIVTVFLLVILEINYVDSFLKTIYKANLVIMASIVIVSILCIYNNYRANKEIEKTEVLLEFMKKYEKMIDDDRIKRHEILNNLLTLKSFKNKNCKEYNETIDEFIDTYNKRSDSSIKNIGKLPTGLKGIIYYKIKEEKYLKINTSIKISKNINNILGKLNHKEYLKLCKITGIILDNALEATSKTKSKLLVIDIYKEGNNIDMIVDNTFSGKISIKNIQKKNYSSKGKNRGLGLYIAQMLIVQSNCLKMEQNILKNHFITKIIVSINN